MIDGKLLTQSEFWQRNGLSKTASYYLDILGRGPKWICIGTKRMLSFEAEAEWRREMEANPVRGDLRKLAEAFKKSSAAGRQSEAA